nr:hypothetical protein [Pedobacter sp. ASV19]
MLPRPPRSTPANVRRQRQMCIRDRHYTTDYPKHAETLTDTIF